MLLHAGPWLVLIGLACARAISVPVEHSLDGATYEPAGRIEFDADVLVRRGTNPGLNRAQSLAESVAPSTQLSQQTRF